MNIKLKKKFAIEFFDSLKNKIKYETIEKSTIKINNDTKIKLLQSKRNKNFRLHLYIKNKAKWIFTFKRLSYENNHITCYLNNPSNVINKICYKKFKITKDRDYLFCEDLEYNKFVNKYTELLDFVISTHGEYENMEADEFLSDFFEGKIANPKKASRKIHKIIEEYSDIHGKILAKIKEKYKKNGWQVKVESSQDNHRMRIDAVAKKGKDIIFFEVKSYSKARKCIREALGQLLEYSMYYKRKGSKPVKLIVVGPNKQTQQDKDYLYKLRDMHSIPIEYMSLN